MIFDFDSNNLYTQPEIVVCNPDLEQLQYVSFMKDLKLTLKFNNKSELTCTVYEKYMNDQTHKWVDVPCYEHLTKNKVLYVIGIGYFTIYQATENMDGTVNTKDIKAYSFEFTLNKKYVNFEDDTYEFYDPIDNSNTLLGKIIALCPAWTIGHVDSELWTVWRTFSDVDGSQTIYNFLMNDVEEAYGCIFKFDIENMTINAYTPANSISETDIILSFDSTIKDIEIAEDDKSIITALYVAGSGDLTINNVNPLGTPYIYDFSYYKTTKWMGQDLIDALTVWENKIASYQTSYSTKLTELKTLNAELIVLNGQLTDLNSELAVIDAARTARTGEDISELSTQYDAKLVEIAAKKTEITAKEAHIISKTTELTAINNDVKPSNNFTEAQLKVLDAYTYEASYVNDNYEVTDSMTNVDIMELTQQLYNAGKAQMEIVSKPCYTFDLSAVNFCFIKAYQQFISQMGVGKKIYVETDKAWYNPLLLEMTIDYDNPDNLSMKFGNKYRLDDDSGTMAELLSNARQTSSSVKGNSSLWTNGAKAGNLFTEYKKTTLVAANQDIVNSEKQSVTIDQAGIRSKKLLEDDSYSPEQLWINNGLICLTDDNWQTTKLAIGKVNGVYCVNAEVIAGNLLCGAELKIYTADGSLTVDESGTKLVNSMLTLQSTETGGRIKNQILLNPDDGFKIQANTNTGTGTPVYKDIFYLASDGSGVRMEGSLVTFDTIESSGTIYDIATQMTAGGIWFYRKLPSADWDLSTPNNMNDNAQLITRMKMFGTSLVVDGKFSVMDGEHVEIDTCYIDYLYGNETIVVNGTPVPACYVAGAKNLFVENCQGIIGSFTTLTVTGQGLMKATTPILSNVSVSSATCSVSGIIDGQPITLTGTCSITLNNTTTNLSYWA